MNRHEGRNWYSSHRGRMWIASTVKVPTREEIKELEDFYQAFYGKDLVFPKSYPSGCLLGCVEVVDVLPQDQYRTEHPNGESESPFVFVCRNPLELFVKFPIKGQHKLCNSLPVRWNSPIDFERFSWFMFQINWTPVFIKQPRNPCSFNHSC